MLKWKWYDTTDVHTQTNQLYSWINDQIPNTASIFCVKEASISCIYTIFCKRSITNFGSMTATYKK